MLESPIVVFMESGYNVYALQRAARHSSRIGQKWAVNVFFLGCAGNRGSEMPRRPGGLQLRASVVRVWTTQ